MTELIASFWLVKKSPNEFPWHFLNIGRKVVSGDPAGKPPSSSSACRYPRTLRRTSACRTTQNNSLLISYVFSHLFANIALIKFFKLNFASSYSQLWIKWIHWGDTEPIFEPQPVPWARKRQSETLRESGTAWGDWRQSERNDDREYSDVQFKHYILGGTQPVCYPNEPVDTGLSDVLM